MRVFKAVYSPKSRLKRLDLFEDTKLIIMSDMHGGRAEVGCRSKGTLFNNSTCGIFTEENEGKEDGGRTRGGNWTGDAFGGMASLDVWMKSERSRGAEDRDWEILSVPFFP